MLFSKSFVRTLREEPSDSGCASYSLMLRAGLIRKIANGLFAYLPPGLRSLRKVELIVRLELDAAGALEILPPVIVPGELWRESGRWDAMGDSMLRARGRQGNDLVVSPTAEELFTAIARGDLASYRDLPLTLYQINTKYRDELRPRYGIMRAREFIMMDAYSFGLDGAELDASYRAMAGAYGAIFRACGLRTLEVKADCGDMGGSESEEFMVESEIGDDILVSCRACGYASNLEAAGPAALGAGSEGGADGRCPSCGATLRKSRGNELGHIFKLGDKYSGPMNLRVLDSAGERRTPLMGCYGIGMDRLLASIIEERHEGDSIDWPVAVAPWHVAVVPTLFKGAVRERALALGRALEGEGLEVLLDDRDERAGVKLRDADLLGLPLRAVLGGNGGEGMVELRRGRCGRTILVAQADCPGAAKALLEEAAP